METHASHAERAAARQRRRSGLRLDHRTARLAALVATNFTGHPCLVLRAGFHERRPFALETYGEEVEGAALFRAPHATTLCGRLFDEGTLCELGMALERELGVSSERPTG